MTDPGPCKTCGLIALDGEQCGKCSMPNTDELVVKFMDDLMTDLNENYLKEKKLKGE